MSQDDPDVSLGFVAQPENVEHLKSKYFPSKMGGKPAWLSPLELPSTKDLTCPICKKPFVFLLQAYAPLEDQEECFHRTVFVFICRNGECYSDRSNRPFAVLRSQLPRKNNFYSFEPCKLDAGSKGEATFEELVSADDSQRTPLCTLCGCTGRLWCSRCRGPRYCGKDHQVMHWKHGHKAECQPAPKDSDAKAPLTTAKWSRVMAADAAKSILLPEMELVIESEVELEIEDEGIGAGSDSDGDEGESEEQQLKDFKTYVQSSGGKSGALDGEVSNEELQAAAADGIGVTDACFKAFKRKIAIAPEQVLRHNRDGEPLWLSAKHQAADSDVPDCACGAKRTFEFQILPQLLAHLHLDTLAGPSVDWATLAIYTCSQSCTLGNPYKSEFVWKQDF